MKNKLTKKQKRSFVAIFLCLALLITGLFAFLTAHDSKINRFTLGDMKVVVREPDWTDDNDVPHNGWYSNTPDSNGNYPVLHDDNGNGIPDFAEDILPGQPIDKAPYAENTGSLDSWTFMMVGIPASLTDTNGKIPLGSSLSDRTKQITVRAFSTQTGYIEGTETPAAVWNQFTLNNDIYGQKDVSFITSVLSSAENITAYYNNRNNVVNKYYLTRAEFESDINDMIALNPQAAVAYYSDTNANTMATDINDAVMVQMTNYSTGIQPFGASVNIVKGVLYGSDFYAQLQTAIDSNAVTSIVQGGSETNTIPENVIETVEGTTNKAELFDINDINTDNFTLIPYSATEDCFVCVDGYNYYVYAYNTLLPAGESTERLFTNVSLSDDVIITSNNHSTSTVSIDITQGQDVTTVALLVNEGSLLNETTVTDLLVTNGYNRNDIESVSYAGTPASATTWVASTAAGETYYCTAVIS